MADDATPKKAPAKATAQKPAAAKAAAKAAAPKAAAAKPAAEAKAAAPKAAAAKPAAEVKAPAAKATPTSSATAKSKATPTSSATAKSKAASTGSATGKTTAKKAPVEHVARPQVLKVHHLRPATGAKKAKTRVGRGEGSKGKTAGRGTKGTKARYQVRVGMEGGNLNSVMRAPKLRGFKNPFRVEYQVVNLDRLAELYPKGGNVTVSDLVAKGAVRSNEKVKVLGNGDITVKLNVAVDKVSGSAEQKILAAGGSIK
jgi:large subunit ribosomal protein L15